MKRIIRLTEADIKNIVQKVIGKNYKDNVSSLDNSNIHNFRLRPSDMKIYVDMFGPIKVINGEYACQKRNSEWMCYNSNDKHIPTEKIMDELDLRKFGFTFDDFIESYG